MADISQLLFSARDHRARGDVRGPRRPRRAAGQRPPHPGGARRRPRSRPGPAPSPAASRRARSGRRVRDHAQRGRQPAGSRRAGRDGRCVRRPARRLAGDLRAIIVGRGPWGNLFEFSDRLRDVDPRRLPVPAAALPDPLDRLHPGRRRARAAAVRVEPAVGDLRARAGAPERAAADDPRRDGRVSATGSSRRRSRPASGTWSRASRTGSRGCRATRSSTRSPTGR